MLHNEHARYDDHSDLLFFFRNQTELISYTLLQGKLRRLGVQCMSTYARACISIRFCPSCVLVLHCVRAVTSFTLLRPPTCRTWASLWRLVLGTMLPSPASPCDPGSLCLLAGPLPPLHPCPLLLWAGFDTRLCSLPRICRPWFTRPRVGVGASRSPGAGAVSSLFPRSALPRAGLSM